MSYLVAGLTMLTLTALAAAPASSEASGFQYEFGTVFSGKAPMPTNGPWLGVLFQSVSPGKVLLTIEDPNLASGESISSLFFNLNPTLNPDKLNFSIVSHTGTFTLPQIEAGSNRFNVCKQGEFDVNLSFSDSRCHGRDFGAGDSLVILISGIRGLTAADFDCPSYPTCRGDATPYAAAELNGTGSTDSWVDSVQAAPITPVPEPAPGLLVSLGMALTLLLRRK
jgi:hypothetical protein